MARSASTQRVVDAIRAATSEPSKKAASEAMTRAQLLEFYRTAAPDEHNELAAYVWNGAYIDDQEVLAALRAADGARDAHELALQAKMSAFPFLADEAAAHLETLSPGFDWATTKFLIVLINRRRPGATVHRRMTLLQMLVTLPAKQREGYEVYVAVHDFAREVRRTADVVRARAYFADYDFAKEAADGRDMSERFAACFAMWLRSRACMLVHTGNGIHAYWRVPETDPASRNLKLWSRVEAPLVEALGSDPAVKDPARVLRLAGTANLKDRQNPKYCRVIARSRAVTVADRSSELVQLLGLEMEPLKSQPTSPDSARATTREPVAKGGVATTIDARVTKILNRIPGRVSSETSPTEHRWVAGCPDPAHNDRKPSFIVMAKSDGSIRLHCRSRCSRRTGEWLTLLGLPEELQSSDKRLRSGWYEYVETEEGVGGNVAVENALRTLASHGLKPEVLREGFAIWTFFCPRGQTSDGAVIHARTGRVEHPCELKDEDAAPLARMFVTVDTSVQLRCRCPVCTDQTARRASDATVPSAQMKLFEVLRLAMGSARTAQPQSRAEAAPRGDLRRVVATFVDDPLAAPDTEELWLSAGPMRARHAAK